MGRTNCYIDLVSHTVANEYTGFFSFAALPVQFYAASSQRIPDADDAVEEGAVLLVLSWFL